MTEALEQLIAAFDRGDLDAARSLSASARNEPPREIERAVDALQQSVGRLGDPQQAASFEEILKQLTALVCVAQADLRRKVLPRMRAEGRRYRKFREVHVRKAAPDEKIVSTTEDGRETENTAKAGDWVVRNTTRAREQYVVSDKKFKARYRPIGDLDGEWQRYQPLGEVFGIEVDSAVLELLGKSGAFFIEAPWGEAQRVRPGDELAAPPDFGEVYRIARAEFRDTYEPAAER